MAGIAGWKEGGSGGSDVVYPVRKNVFMMCFLLLFVAFRRLQIQEFALLFLLCFILSEKRLGASTWYE